MAARKIPTVDTPAREWPLPVNERPAVRATSTLARNVQAEVERATAALVAAEIALEASSATAAEALVQAIDEGREPPPEDPELTSAVDAARRRLEQAQAALRIAAQRHQEALVTARRDLAAEARPRIAELMATVMVQAREAVETNDLLRSLAQFVVEQGAEGHAPWEVALRLPDMRTLDEQVEARRRLLNPEQRGPRPGHVGVRWVVVSHPNQPGDESFMPRDEAVQMIRAGIVELVDPALSKELGVDKLASFTGPTRVRFVRPHTTKSGTSYDVGAIDTLDAKHATRVVNLAIAVEA